MIKLAVIDKTVVRTKVSQNGGRTKPSLESHTDNNKFIFRSLPIFVREIGHCEGDPQSPVRPFVISKWFSKIKHK